MTKSRWYYEFVVGRYTLLIRHSPLPEGSHSSAPGQGRRFTYLKD